MWKIRLPLKPKENRRLVRLLVSFAFLGAMGCGAFSQPNGPAISPEALAQSMPLEDPSIRYNPAVTKAGVSREQVEGALGPPNATMTLANEEEMAVYAFFPDGGKFVNPGLGPRFFSHSAGSAVSSAKLEAARRELTFYRIRYSLDGAIISVSADRPIPTSPALSP